ncbi:MAG: extensin family protein [Novosphingobium sp.]
MRTTIALCLTLSLLAGCEAIPSAPAPRKSVAARSTAVITPNPVAQACFADLGSRSANFTPLPDQYFGAGCSTVGTVRLASLKSDRADLRLAGLGPMTCPLADTLAGWARYGVDRAAQQILGSPLVKIETMGSYNCRNIAGSPRRSAHATGNAVDISGFVLADGRRITVAGNWADKSPTVQRFFTTIHASACKRFGTVLSPAYNAAHYDHLHLEMSGRNYCK